MPERITLEEWLNALQGVTGQEAPEGFSVTDIMDQTGMSRRTVSAKMSEWFRRGVVEFAGYRQMRAMDGRTCKIPIYKIAKAAQ